MSKLEQTLKNINYKYEELKIIQDVHTKLNLSTQLIQLCILAQKQIDLQIPSPKLFRHKTHISAIKTKAQQLHKQSQLTIQRGGKNKYDAMISSINVVIQKQKQEQQNMNSNNKNKKNQKQQQNKLKLQQNQKQLSRKVCLYIAQKQLTSKQIKVSPQQYIKIADRMQKNCQLMGQIKSIIVQHGNDIQLVQKRIDQAYDNTLKANTDLKDAADIQLQTRLTKIRLGLTGVIAAIGYAILGIPGFIVGGVVGLYRALV